MSLCHGWGRQRQPPQTVSHIHIRHIQNVWAHWYAVHQHTVAALHSYTHKNKLRYWGFLDHLWSQNAVAALHSYTHTTWIRFWGSGSLMESKWCRYVMIEADSHLNCFSYLSKKYSKCLSTLICCPLAYNSSLTQLYSQILAQILGFWVTCGVKMISLCHGWGWQPPQTVSHIHIRHVQSVWAHWYAVHKHAVSALHS